MHHLAVGLGSDFPRRDIFLIHTGAVGMGAGGGGRPAAADVGCGRAADWACEGWRGTRATGIALFGWLAG